MGGLRCNQRLEEIGIPASEAGCGRVEEGFTQAIRGLEPVRLTTFEGGVRHMEFTRAAIRRFKTGQTVHLPLGNR